MKKVKNYVFLILLIILFNACEKDEDIDTEKPEIDLSLADAFPVQCDTIYFGETFEFKALFSDNVELGSFSIDIHNNFDHHSHSTEVSECEPEPDKDPVNPYLFINDYDIPVSLNEYETAVFITVPSGDGTSLYDEGDYHFYISLTDKEGWSTQKGLSIKMLHR